MKKSLAVPLLAGVFTLFALVGCADSPAALSSDGLPLDDAIKQAAAVMEAKLPAKAKVAVINVQSPSLTFSEYALDYLESILVNDGKLTVVDRSNLDKIRQELGFQLSGEVSDESAKKIGKMIGADAIITGTLFDSGKVYTLTLQAINIESATVAASYPADVAKDSRMRALLAGGSSTAIAGAVAAEGATEQQQAQKQTPTYKIGDTGPAGGIIFYDKGYSLGGWRYLEAAPANTERSLIYSRVDLGEITYTSRKVGSGKDDSQAVLQLIDKKGGEINTALWYCRQLVVNGFNDWFLPSLDEALYMYNNLYQNDIGGFKDGAYWTSCFSYYSPYIVDFNSGEEHWGEPSDKHLVRPIREF